VPHVAGVTYDPGVNGGTTTIEVDGNGQRVREYVSLAGSSTNCAGGRTPWNTWLTCEETFQPANATKPHGYVFEVDPYDQTANHNDLPISWGGLCWAPDINAWTHLVAQRLNHGGSLVISEHHPLWEVLTVTDEDRLSVSGDYFVPDRAGYADPLKAPEITRTLGVPDLPHKSFVWSIGNVIGAVLTAGLTLRSFQEFSESDMYPALGDTADRIPATYLLTATR